MGTGYNPRIVTDGLVLCLDAANARSYPGTGSVWYDISGNGNHFNLYNAPTFDSDNGGSISFNGTDEYARSVNTIDLSHDGTYMVEAIWKVANNQNNFLWELSANWNSNDAACGIVLHGDGAGYRLGRSHQNHKNRTNGRNCNIPTENMKWNVSVQLLSSNYDPFGTLVYINNDLQDFVVDYGYSTSKSSDNYASVGRNDYIWLGARNGSVAPLLGNIASFKIYKDNKLSQEQIRQNYLATKERYA